MASKYAHGTVYPTRSLERTIGKLRDNRVNAGDLLRVVEQYPDSKVDPGRAVVMSIDGAMFDDDGQITRIFGLAEYRGGVRRVVLSMYPRYNVAVIRPE